jgi:hypothetical protein
MNIGNIQSGKRQHMIFAMSPDEIKELLDDPEMPEGMSLSLTVKSAESLRVVLEKIRRRLGKTVHDYARQN